MNGNEAGKKKKKNRKEKLISVQTRLRPWIGYGLLNSPGMNISLQYNPRYGIDVTETTEVQARRGYLTLSTSSSGSETPVPHHAGLSQGCRFLKS